MNRRNLLAAVLAGLAGAAGIVGSAQASWLGISDSFALEVKDIVVSVNTPITMSQPLGASGFDATVIHNLVVKEVIAIIGGSLLSDKYILAGHDGGSAHHNRIDGCDMDDMSKEDAFPTDIVVYLTA